MKNGSNCCEHAGRFFCQTYTCSTAVRMNMGKEPPTKTEPNKHSARENKCHFILTLNSNSSFANKVEWSAVHCTDKKGRIRQSLVESAANENLIFRILHSMFSTSAPTSRTIFPKWPPY